jgi:hypothetical protein
MLMHVLPPHLPDNEWLDSIHGFDRPVKIGKPLSISLPLAR